MTVCAPNIVKENAERIKIKEAVFDPVTGEGSLGDRKKVRIKDFPIETQWLPVEMLEDPMVAEVVEKKTLKKYLRARKIEPTDENLATLVEQLLRIRIQYDFPFWAILYVIIQNKLTGLRTHFKLNAPQRKLINEFEQMRKQGLPIRVVLLKARQWGGSTATQLYMAWIQLVLAKGRNSVIVAHQKKASYGVRNMLKRMATYYPIRLVHDIDDVVDMKESILCGTPSPNVIQMPARECEIEVGSAENPDSERSANLYLAHLTEVAFWKSTENKNPGQIVTSVCGSVPELPLTLIVYESTANGTGNFFQEEYDAAKNKRSIFHSLFVAWYEIEMYSTPFASEEEKFAFADWLIDHRDQEEAPDNRHEPGKYLWWLWTQGATLENINWYIKKRTIFHSHAGMAAEYPSDDIEAFQNSGRRIFDMYDVEKFKQQCRIPKAIGEMHAFGRRGEDALKELRFVANDNGNLKIWNYPETFKGERVAYRYVVSVDIGGRSDAADYSVIKVFDRYEMMEDGLPVVVAMWRGHCDHDILAWKAAQIATYYDNALLVIESNTLETKDKNRDVDGDQSSFILNELREVYPNLYARKQSAEDIRNRAPRKYGFHTNVKTKGDIISLLIEVVREGLYVERDLTTIDEYLTYEEHDGSFDAIEGRKDDCLMATSIGLWVCYKEMPRPYFEKIEETATIKRVAVNA